MDFSPVLISLQTAAVSIFFTFFLGLAAAFWVHSIRRPVLKTLLDAIFTLPLVLPPTVAGFFLLYTFGVRRPLGEFLLHFLGVKIVFSWPATVLAAVALSFPLMYRGARGAFAQVDETILHAARTIGMGEWAIFWRILLPMAAPGVAGGGILAFARGLGEFGATAMIAGNIAGKTRTLPLAVYSAVTAGDMRTAADYVLVLLGISFLAVVGINCLAEKGRGGFLKRGTKK